MLKKVVVYKDTGFNGTDIPATRQVLEAIGSQNQIVYQDVYFIREDLDAPIIRINDTYENLKYVDYVKISNQDGSEPMYYFAIPKSFAKKTTAIYLQLDALTTMGGAAVLNYTSGWQTRGHLSKGEDDLFVNNSDEDFMPSQELKISHMEKLEGDSSTRAKQSIVVSSVDLADFYETDWGDYVAKVMEGKVAFSDEEAKMYWPAVRACQRSTEYKVRDDRYTVPQTCAYRYASGKVKAALGKLFSIGQLSLQSSYLLPYKWYTNATYYDSDSITGGKTYELIEGYSGTKNTSINYELSVPDYTIKNKKVHSMFRKICLQSVSTGDICIKKPSEVYDGSEQLSVLVWADPGPNGKPYARFSNINSVDGHNQFIYDGCVKGAPWVNNQLVFEGASGSVWNSISAGMANAAAQRNYDQYMTNARASLAANNRALSQAEEKADSFISNLKGTIGQMGRDFEEYIPAAIMGGSAGVGTVAAGVGLEVLPAAAPAVATATAALAGMQSARQSDLSLKNSIANMQDQQQLYQDNKLFAQENLTQSINENGIGQLRSNHLVAPTVMFSPEANLSLYGHDYFVVYEVVMQADDIKALDKYFQRFGYAGLHRPLDSSCFQKRSHYCYVQAYDINIDSQFPMRVRNAAILQLNGGVRVWYEKPNAAAYEIN